MGFYFDEFSDGKKQHINLSSSAWIVIEQDMKNFNLNTEKDNKAGFFNQVFENFYESANASITFRCMAKKQRLYTLFDHKDFDKLDDQIKEKIINRMINVYKEELLEKALSYPKGHGDKFRIQKDNCFILENDIQDDEYYEGSIGTYLKALYEEYCEKPNYEREQIFFKKIVDEAKKGIDNRCKLKIAIKEKLNLNENKKKSRRFYVTPYKIVQDATMNYNYIVGFAEEILDDNTLSEKKVSSFRISRISTIKAMNSFLGFISNKDKDLIEHELITKLPQFMAGDTIDIKVKFTKKGIENFKRQLYMRPLFYNIDQDDKSIYTFHCTEIQAINYFIKFLRDVEILEPDWLRTKFINRYKSALEVYNKVDDE